MPIRHPVCRDLLCLLLLIPLYGCASTPRVLLTRWHPVDFDVQGVDRLAVLPFDGKGEPAEEARGFVLQELRQRGFYTLVDEPTARNLGAGAAYLGQKGQLQQAMIEARELGIDVLLAAQLRGRLEMNSGLLGGALSTGDPTVAVKLSYDLIHVPTGRILTQQSIVRDYQGELSETDGGNNTAEQVAQRLVRECATEMIADITAHPESFEVTLADASWGDEDLAEIGQGNEAAEKGEWREAIDHWHAALEANPNSHAAMYNLGIAFEHAGDLPGAVGWYTKAIGEKDREPYQTALARVEAGREPFRLAQLQVWRPRHPAAAVHQNQFVGAQGSDGDTPTYHPSYGGRQPAYSPVAMPPGVGGRF